MKSFSNIIKVISVLIITLTLSVNINAQGPPPPPGGGSNSGSNQNGGNAPIGSGAVILLGLAAAYGGRKYIHDRNKDTN